MSRKFLTLVAVFATALLASVPVGASESGTTQSYLVLANRVNAQLENRIAAAGGTITNVFDQIGIVVVDSDDPSFASQVGVTTVRNLRVAAPQTVVVEGVSADALPPNSGSADFFFDLQWGHIPVKAVEAWAAGSRGAGVRVAVLDSGFDLTHPDLVDNYDLVSAANFVDGEVLQYGLPDPFSHGTHVAGTIAAAENDFGTIGVAPDATIIPIKVLSDEGSGTFEDVIAGILHAADVDADVINMSLGAIIPQGLGPDSAEVAGLRVAVNKAITYAYNQGSTVIVSAGNDALDLNSPDTASFINFNGYASHALSISATAPIGWAVDPANAFLSHQSSYTNIGTEVDFAAPGGDFVYPGNEDCTVAGLLRPCWVFDLVFSTGSLNSWYWSAGTSMAAPHAAGIAALIIGENGGDMHPSHVAREMRKYAEDLGKSGRDDVYGHGLVTSGH
jgi:lantibiotic leader peptide-processing serine protease